MRLPRFVSLPLTALAASLAVASPVVAQDAPEASEAPTRTPPPAPPRLLVVVSVDQFSADLFAQYRARFTGGLARLLGGAVFPSAYQAHAATETCPGHSTIGTGVRPARSGIIANNWFAPSIARADKRVYCAEDENDPASTSRDPVVSPNHLKVPTLADRIKAADPQSRNVAVAGKDRAAMMMGGHSTDGAYWWTKAGFATLKGRTPGAAAEGINRLYQRGIPQTGKGNGQLTAPPWCESRKREVAVGNFTIGATRFKRPASLDDAAWVSPWLDVAVAGLAVKLVDEFALGRDDHVDVLSVGLSATDYIGHAYGSEGYEMCVQMAQVDRTLGTLLAELDRRKIDYAVALTADHGGLDAPERLVEQAMPGAARQAPDLDTDALARALTEKTGIAATSGPLLFGGTNGDLYLSAQLSTEAKVRAARALRDIVLAHPQVAAVFTAQQLAEAPLPSGSPQDWSLLDRARASFDAKRSGDLIVLLDRGVVPVDPRSGYVATHGSPWDYDRRVPLLFWRKGMTGFEQPAPVETVDLAPTLAHVAGLAIPEGAFDGRCLDIDGGPGNSCAR